MKIAGRMMLKRVMGKASFAVIQDESGRIQLFLSADNAAGRCLRRVERAWDMGDIIAARRRADAFQHGRAVGEGRRSVRLLTKSLRPLPDKFHGLADAEQRYRQRYVDLIVTRDARRRSSCVPQGHRRAFAQLPDDARLPGSRNADAASRSRAAPRPSRSSPHHNALDMELYLRIAPELYLKRLVVGGFERVFEINRNFRNEGVSAPATTPNSP